MTGPPTPPPSSATEIQDAARTTLPPPQAAAAAEAAAPPTGQPTPVQAQPDIAGQTEQKDLYELLFPSIEDLARSGSLKDLIEVAERGDLSAESDGQQTRLLLVAPLVLAYMIVDQLPPARHVLTRLPDNLKSVSLTQGLFNLLASTYERKYTQVYVRAEELQQSVQQPAFSNAPFGQVLAGMITAFVEAFRKRTFALLARAYTSIPLALAQMYLGLTAEQILNVAVPNGWVFDETNHVLTPPQQSAASSRRTDPVPSTLSALNLVADSVANLEG